MNRSEPGRLKRLMSIMRCTRLVLPSRRTYLQACERQPWYLQHQMVLTGQGHIHNCPAYIQS